MHRFDNSILSQLPRTCFAVLVICRCRMHSAAGVYTKLLIFVANSSYTLPQLWLYKLYLASLFRCNNSQQKVPSDYWISSPPQNHCKISKLLWRPFENFFLNTTMMRDIWNCFFQYGSWRFWIIKILLYQIFESLQTFVSLSCHWGSVNLVRRTFFWDTM